LYEVELGLDAAATRHSYSLKSVSRITLRHARHGQAREDLDTDDASQC